jgi:hypothetical protein
VLRNALKRASQYVASVCHELDGFHACHERIRATAPALLAARDALSRGRIHLHDISTILASSSTTTSAAAATASSLLEAAPFCCTPAGMARGIILGVRERGQGGIVGVGEEEEWQRHVSDIEEQVGAVKAEAHLMAACLEHVSEMLQRLPTARNLGT